MYHDFVLCLAGAVQILRNIDNIDFSVLFTGRVCWDEVNRIKRIVRMDCVKYPIFMKNMNKYLHMLKHIAYVNGLAGIPTRNVARATWAMSAPVRTTCDLRLLNFNFNDPPVVLKLQKKAKQKDGISSSCSDSNASSDESTITERSQTWNEESDIAISESKQLKDKGSDTVTKISLSHPVSRKQSITCSNVSLPSLKCDTRKISNTTTTTMNIVVPSRLGHSRTFVHRSASIPARLLARPMSGPGKLAQYEQPECKTRTGEEEVKKCQLAIGSWTHRGKAALEN